MQEGARAPSAPSPQLHPLDINIVQCLFINKQKGNILVAADHAAGVSGGCDGPEGEAREEVMDMRKKNRLIRKGGGKSQRSMMENV